MQIGFLNHWNFSKTANQPQTVHGAQDNAGGAAVAATGATKLGLGVAVRQMTPANDATGVILKLGSEGDTAPGLVYSNALGEPPRGQAAPTRPQDFVSFAVSAMREYADEQNRLKATSKQDGNPSPVSLLARFKLFA